MGAIYTLWKGLMLRFGFAFTFTATLDFWMMQVEGGGAGYKTSSPCHSYSRQ